METFAQCCSDVTSFSDFVVNFPGFLTETSLSLSAQTSVPIFLFPVLNKQTITRDKSII